MAKEPKIEKKFVRKRRSRSRELQIKHLYLLLNIYCTWNLVAVTLQINSHFVVCCEPWNIHGLSIEGVVYYGCSHLCRFEVKTSPKHYHRVSRYPWRTCESLIIEALLIYIIDKEWRISQEMAPFLYGSYFSNCSKALWEKVTLVVAWLWF